ncbi:peptide synthetase [Marichromatium purpuratum 984]|uniref:Peptide synthetase n=1 Tax=Marichromatium purpuratum 984 TaxID=765910 RepID=W0DWH3_MARPU|nr:non-ribosomal peptide synthetase [Marichromatium purpuratum]AHF02960.1 peptide synthetase [Marichromatium purpuratum 984]
MNDQNRLVSDLIDELGGAGILLWEEAGQLRFKAPAGALDERRRAAIKSNREAIIAYLAGGEEALGATSPERYEPFPLTDLQLAYIVGRRDNYDLGGVGCHNYLELDLPPLDPQRLERAWHELIERHDMLRAVIGSDGTQRVLRNVSLPPLRCDDRRGASAEVFEQAVLASRDEMAFRRYDAERWPLYELRLTLGDERSILHYSTDLLIADFASIQLLLAELGERYEHPERALPPLSLTFRDLVTGERARGEQADTQARRRAHREYWMQRLPELPDAPELPLLPATVRGKVEGASFERFGFDLPAADWQAFCASATRHQLTPTAAVMAVFTEVLRRWSRREDFCINLTLLNRPAQAPEARRVVGDFIAINVLEVRGDSGATFLDRARAVQERLWQDMAHADFSGIEVLRELSRQQRENRLIPVVFTSTLGVSGDELPRNAFMHDAKLNYGITQTPQVWLDCQATERRGALHVDWDVRRGIFPAGVIEQAFAAFGEVVSRLAREEAAWGAERPVALPESTRLQREQINHERDAPLPRGYLHGGFCRRALEAPQHPALLCGARGWSYRELADWALDLAERLQAAGCVAGEPVALCLDKGPAQVAAVLGTLLADAAYVPIDVTQPSERRARILADVGARVVVTDAARAVDAWPEAVVVVAMGEPGEARAEAARRAALEAAIARGEACDTASRLAYVLYTSGTTGRPKGVMLTHQGVLNTIVGFNRQFGLHAEDRALGLVNYSFDLSVLDLFCTFTAGATLVLPEGQWRSDPASWVAAIERHKATVWNSVPAHMQMLLASLSHASDLSSLRLGFVSGDWIPVTLPEQVRRRLPGLQLNSLGGPTEISVTCIHHRIDEVPEGATSIPYGSPFSNHRLYVLDRRLESCPDWVAGEMYVGGPGVALGFANDPERTAQRFITHPRSGERLYRTGDICRYRGDGVIEILGREDNQVKIRGHRIELGDVEAALGEIDGVARGVALVRAQPLDLVAAVVPSDPRAEAPAEFAERLRRELGELLPGYMIPVALEVLPQIPLSRNGKVDRKALAEHFQGATPRETDFEPPLDDPLEQRLAQVWRELTEAERVSRDDDFFMIGGSSLSAVGLLNWLMEEGFGVNIDLIFNHSVFRDMVEALRHASDAEERFREEIDLEALATHAMRHLDAARPERATDGPTEIFMTGATGYLGVYVLRRLLRDSDNRLNCLVRCRDPQDGLQRIRQVAEEKGVELELDPERVRILPGDLTADRFGLSDAVYAELAERIDKVVHVAALISLIAPLSRLYPINVKGSANAIELACTGRRKPIHYMSTIGVHYRLPYGEEEPPIPEATGPDAPWHKPELTYEHTKYMAEQLFHMARQRGVSVNIFRSGAITWDSEQERPFINDDAFVKFFRTCSSVNAYPEASILISVTPVNLVAEYIGMLVGREIGGTGQNYHLVSERSLGGNQIYRWFNELGCEFAALDFERWNQRLDDSFGRGFINRYFRHGISQGGHHQYRIDNLREVLVAQGRDPHRVERDYFLPLLEHFGSLKGAERGGACQST